MEMDMSTLKTIDVRNSGEVVEKAIVNELGNDDWSCESCKYVWRELNPSMCYGNCPNCTSEVIGHY